MYGFGASNASLLGLCIATFGSKRRQRTPHLYAVATGVEKSPSFEDTCLCLASPPAKADDEGLSTVHGT